MNPDQTSQVSSLTWVHIVCYIGYKSTKQAKHVVKAEKGFNVFYLCPIFIYFSCIKCT